MLTFCIASALWSSGRVGATTFSGATVEEVDVGGMLSVEHAFFSSLEESAGAGGCSSAGTTVLSSEAGIIL